MTPGTAISATAHALLLAWGLFTFSARPFDVAAANSVMADVISESEFSQLTAGIKTAPQKEKPQPIVDKIGDPKPAPADPVAKASEKPEVRPPSADPAAAPPPPPPPPQPTPHAVTPPAASKSKPEPMKPEPDPILEALKKEEAKRKEEAKKQDEAKKREEAKRREEAKKRDEAKREENKFDFDRIQTALLDKRVPQRQVVTGSMVNPAPSLGTSLANASVLSQNEIDALRAQLYGCWNPPVGVLEAKDLLVTVRFSLNRDGSLSGEPSVTNHGTHALFQIAAESALRAVRRCQPFRLPVVKYDAWQEVEVSFRPEDMFPR